MSSLPSSSSSSADRGTPPPPLLQNEPFPVTPNPHLALQLANFLLDNPLPQAPRGSMAASLIVSNEKQVKELLEMAQLQCDLKLIEEMERKEEARKKKEGNPSSPGVNKRKALEAVPNDKDVIEEGGKRVKEAEK